MTKEQINELEASGSAEASIPIAKALFNLSASSDVKKVDILRTKYCKNQQLQIDSTDFEFIASKVVNPNVADNWLECIKAKEKAAGAQSDIEGMENLFAFKIRFNSATPGDNAIIQNLNVVNADCDKNFLPLNSKIYGNWQLMPCVRTDKGKDQGVSITLSFKGGKGGSTQTLDPIPKPKPIIAKFSVVPDKVKPNRESVLVSWSVVDADKVELFSSDNAQTPVSTNKTDAFSRLFDKTTVYTLRAVASGGEVSHQTTITVVPLVPIVDTDKEKILDSLPGTAQMSSCPVGYALAGIHRKDQRTLCRRVIVNDDEKKFIESIASGPNLAHYESRNSIHACPQGYYIRGYHEANDQLICSRDVRTKQPLLSSEQVNTVNQTPTVLGMHACPNGTDLIGVATGVNVSVGYGYNFETFLCNMFPR